MIISRKHHYIFLHCRKTAGSSIAVSLARDLGPDDMMLSGLEAVEEGIAPPESVTRDAWAYLRHLPLSKAIPRRMEMLGLLGARRRATARHKLSIRLWRDRLGEARPMHAHAETIARAFPEEWAAFPKFCVVRNPWTKTVSDYFWRIKGRASPPTFEDFVRAIERGDPLDDIVQPRYHDNWPLYTIDDRIVADHVIRFESLSAGLSDTCAALGIPFDGWLPRAKGSHRPKAGARADPFSYYTPELRDTVGRLYEKEIDAFGYSFGPTTA